MSRPIVSVLTPVYNGERWLSEAIESALAQTFTDFELLVVDDGSTDRSASIVESFAERDPRVRLVRTAHSGVRAARGISLEEARAPFVAFLDADDTWVARRLERQLPYVDEETLVFSDAYLALEDSPPHERYNNRCPAPEVDYPATGLFPQLLRGCFIALTTVLAPRGPLVDAGAFRDVHGVQTAAAGDWEMWMLLALRGLRFYYVDEPLATYRRHSGSITGDWLRVTEGGVGVFDRLLAETQGDDRRSVQGMRRRNQQRLEVAYRKRGWQKMVAGDARSARHALARSLRARPYSPRAWLALSLTLCPPVARRLVRGRA